MNTEKIRLLLKKIKQSDISAFNTLFKIYENDIFNFLLFKLLNKETAEDLLQEVFLILWENRSKINIELSIKAYLYTSAKNLSINHFRHNSVIKRHEENALSETSYYESPQEIYEKDESNKTLLNTINKLPEKTRVTFLMSRVDGLAYKEIAERLNISIKTVENQIGSALKKLRDLLA